MFYIELPWGYGGVDQVSLDEWGPGGARDRRVWPRPYKTPEDEKQAEFTALINVRAGVVLEGAAAVGAVESSDKDLVHEDSATIPLHLRNADQRDAFLAAHLGSDQTVGVIGKLSRRGHDGQGERGGMLGTLDLNNSRVSDEHARAALQRKDVCPEQLVAALSPRAMPIKTFEQKGEWAEIEATVVHGLLAHVWDVDRRASLLLPLKLKHMPEEQRSKFPKECVEREEYLLELENLARGVQIKLDQKRTNMTDTSPTILAQLRQADRALSDLIRNL
eukprot:TRINITY_DN6503_c0_g1_i4.p1 TRINITY_DN6503_c0_g1~~TRINITY_DN6503_c0_g1_i4.p1  ORF type:complete len:276 (-),score=49.07 TRINITY_DN6503_c0_g1_i4:64-891(-)